MASRQRLGELNQAVLTVLRDEGALARADVVARVKDKVPPSKGELQPANRKRPGVDRYTNRLGWLTTGTSGAGLITKKGGTWFITEAGRELVNRVSDPLELQREIEKRYQDYLKSDRQLGSPERRELLERALSVVEEGAWTSYSDLAELVSTTPMAVGSWISAQQMENSYRVLKTDGSVSPDFKWVGEDRGNPVDLLAAEGIKFDEQGRASHDHRLTAADLRDMLELGDKGQQRGWLVRGANVHGQNVVPDWLANGYCSIAAPELDEIPGGSSRQEIRNLVDEEFADASSGSRSILTSLLHSFLTTMSKGDLVVTVDEDEVFVGEITGDPEYVETLGRLSSRRRAVRWVNKDKPLRRGELAPSAQGKLKGQRAISQLGAELGHFARAVGLEGLVSPDVAAKPTPDELRLAPPTKELAEHLLLPRAWLQEVVELLGDKRQIVFYGPPGTGKTYVAQALAEHLAGKDRVKLVQFHPSYSYEDFFEGIRPRLTGDSGSLAYELVPGPFRKLVDLAREDPAHAYVLIIDEINRANLAKVFGELYFLLEYRSTAIELLYSGEEDFTLPENVFVIGTMNTADRSIALVDAAMRRRFAFQAFFPDQAPIKGVLRRWLERENMWLRPAQLLDRLNREIADPHFAIGPSYLMTSRAANEEGLQRIWRTSILPLLEEHFFGEGREVPAQFGIAALSTAPAAEANVDSPDATTTEP